MKDKVVIVTGAAQGIGKAIADHFASCGARVVLADVKKTEHDWVHCDVSDNESVKKMVSYVLDKYGKIDVVVNNAAIAIYKLLEEYETEEWDKVLATNLNSLFFTSRHVLATMKQQKSGSIIHISSVHAKITSTKNAPYIACKGAITALTRAMALECAPYNIRVNCILPGAIATPMLMENWGNVPPEQHPLMSRIPLRRFGDPIEIAKVAKFLATDESAYITGSELLVDGGLSAHFD